MTAVLSQIAVAAALHGVLRDVADEVGRHGLIILFLLIAAESFGSPVPGEVSLLVGAYEAQRGHLVLSSVILVGLAAAITGDNLAYLVGRRAGRPLIERLLRWFHLPRSYLERMDAYYHGHAALTVVIARQVSPLRGLAALSAGGTRVRWRRFFLANAAACVVWATVVTLLATLLVQHLDAVEDDFQLFGLIVVAAIVAMAGVLLWRHRRRAARRAAADVPAPFGGKEHEPVCSVAALPLDEGLDPVDSVASGTVGCNAVPCAIDGVRGDEERHTG